MRSLLLFVATALLSVMPAHAQKQIPAAPPQYVFDEVGWLGGGAASQLSQRLVQYERDTSNQILVAVFASLDGEDLGDYSQRVAEAWRIGQSNRDNGVLLAIYAEDRQFSIEVGYGLEGAITDLVASQILEQRLRPAFRSGQYAAGIDAAVSDLMAAARGEYEGTGRAAGDTRARCRRSPFPIYLLPLMLVFLLGGRRARRNFMGAYLVGSALGGRSSGRRSGGRGFGGGGFTGGGGSFGGGGARGGW
jgi:uncharacterized protein